MMKKLMLCATMVAALFSACSSEDDSVNSQGVEAGKTQLVLLADIEGDGSRFGYDAEGNTLKAKFEEGDQIVYWARKDASLTSGNGGAYFLTYQGMENGKGKFVGTIDGSDLPNGTGNLHMLLCNAFTFNGTNLNQLDLSKQDGTLASAAKHSVFQADPIFFEGESKNADKTVANGVVTISGVKFAPKTSIVKFTIKGAKGLEAGDELTVSTMNVYSKVSIGWGNAGTNSTPSTGTGNVSFTTKVAEAVDGTITTYLSVWPSTSENALGEITINATKGTKKYSGELLRMEPSALKAGLFYRMSGEMNVSVIPVSYWTKDAAGEVTVEGYTGLGSSESVDWLSYSDGKISVSENTTGAPRTGTIYLKDAAGDECPIEITQVEAKDFKGTYSFTTKVFAGTGSYKAKLDPAIFDVTFTDARKGYTLKDAENVEHTNNIGIKGLYHETVMDAAIEIDYANKTAKMGVFFDARDGEGQEANGKYATFVPAFVTMVPNAAWGKSWKFDETELGDPDYAWAWFTISSDFKKILYKNVTNSATESFSVVSQYTGISTDSKTAGLPMNNIAGIDVVISNTNVFNHSTVSGYANVYQTNPKGYEGNVFTRK